MARAAGVSASTASRVLNGGKPVSEDLDARVRQAAADVGYVSNAVASAMRGRRGLLAILTDELGVEALAELSIAAGEAATAAGLTTTVSSAGTEPQQQIFALQVLRSLRPRAIVLTGAWVSEPSIRAELESELDAFVQHENGTVVVLGPAVLPYPSVSFDDYEDGRMVAHHVATGGGRSALILAGPATNESGRLRAEGIEAGLREAGINDIHTLHSRNESGDAEAVVSSYVLSAAPDMILCVNDRLALGAYAAIDGLGLQLPQDVSLSGIDDLPVAHDLEPPLTTVAHPLREAGELVVQLALQGGTASEHRELLPGRLIIRGSTQRTPFPAES
ncbi:LacI family DNA-binding transcriptional regulator [Microbacterium sp. GXF0217]